jgi:hypothetical protein
MNFDMIDLLDKIIAPDVQPDLAILRTEGVLTSDSKVVKNKLNLMTGAYADDLLNAIEEAEMDPLEVIEHLETLCQDNQYMGVFYFLLYLFTAMEMQPPYLYKILPRREDVLQFYISELIADLKDCFSDRDE